MAPEHVFDVERHRIEALADRDHFGRRDEQKHRVRIDEAANQPRAGDAVDFWTRTRHPDGASLRVPGRHLRRRHQREFCGLPTLEAALQRFGRHVDVPEPSGGAFGELLAPQADHDGRTPGECFTPFGGFLRIAPDGAGNQPLVGGKVLVGAHVDQHRRIRHADQACKFIGRYRCVG